MNCDTVTKQLSLMLYGELSFDEEEIVQQHLDVCSPCRDEMAKTQAIHSSFDRQAVEVDPVLLANCRRSLRVATAQSTDTEPRLTRSGGSFWSGLGAWNWFGKPVGAVTLIALGFFGARVLPTGELRMSPMGMGDSGPVASRVRFVEPGESGRVQIVLEETRQRTLSGDMDDASIRTLLVRAARESSDPGVRVETMDLFKGQPQSQDVRRALLHALRQDANAGVRLKALDALRPSAGDPDVRQVLAEVLLKDDNPGVRTQAVDLLTQKREPELVGVLQELMTRENNNYVRMKCQRVLADMNASAETF
jgi:hypothetical protein